MHQISDTCGGGDPGRSLVPGSLRGYRTWRLQSRRAQRSDDSMPLTSVTRDVVWNPTLTASCTPKDAAAAGAWAPDGDADHRAPAAGCRCGIYAWYDPADTAMVRARVFGVVEATGLVLMGDRGFRAERATITAVVTRNRRLVAACEHSGIAVYRRRRDLLRAHPPEDLSSLLGDDHEQPPGATAPPWTSPWTSPNGFDRFVLLAVFGRAALVTAALLALPTAPALVAAVMAHLAVLGFIATRLHH